MAKGNKLYSDRQEITVANYLGWEQVTGSGARPTFVGDIVSESWLGECKTHISPGHKIIFRFDVWDKLDKEASSRFKDPVLIVDDGSQKVENTYVMLKLKHPPEDRTPEDYSTKASFRFDNNSDFRVSYVIHEFIRDNNYYIILWLPAFKTLISRSN